MILALRWTGPVPIFWLLLRRLHAGRTIFFDGQSFTRMAIMEGAHPP